MKPKTDFSSEPLVFPKRPTVAASLIANLEPPKAFKQPIEAATPRPDLNAQADALKKLLDTVVVPKAETTAGRDAAMADSVGSEAAALQAALSGISVADVAASEKVEPLPDLTTSPVWAGGVTLTESLGTAIEAPVPLDAVSPEAAAADLRVVDLSWLNAPAATPETREPAVTPAIDANEVIETADAGHDAHAQPAVDMVAAFEPALTPVSERSVDEMSLEELELATRPDATALTSTAEPVASAIESPALEQPGKEPTLVEPATLIGAPADVATAFSPDIAIPLPDVSRSEPVEPASLAASGERSAKPSRSSKSSRKKRKHGQGQTEPERMTPKVAAVDTDFGFFDPHKHGFMPLVARLNQLTGGVPLR